MVVAPFRPIRDDFDAWIGYREVYGLQDRSKRKYSFLSADLTLFFAPKGQELFEQILRAEWSGPINVASEWIYRPNNAAHPHWQIDIAESLRADPELKAARDLLTISSPKEFGAKTDSSMRDPPWYDLGRMHFASAMRPWIDKNLAHSPITLDAVRSWTIHTIDLLHTELDRL